MATNWNGLKSRDGKVSEKEFNRLVDALQAHSLRPGPNYRLTQTVGGITIVPKGKGGGVASFVCPFTVSITPNADDPDSIDVTVSPGTLNGFLPDNLFDVVTIANTGTFHVKLVALSDGEKITSASIVIDDGPVGAQSPTPYALPSGFSVTLALIQDGVAYRVIGCGSVFLSGKMQFTTPIDTPAAPGEPTLIEYYNWVSITDDL